LTTGLCWSSTTGPKCFNARRYTGSKSRRPGGYSRILRIDPATQQVLWSFEGSKAFPFYTSAQGKSQLLANGNILVTDPEGGRAFEIAPAHGNEVVWEYVNKIDTGDDGDLGRITQASRFDFDGSQFLNLPCP